MLSMDDLWTTVWRGLVNTFTDPSFLQIFGSVISLLVVTAVKRIREGLLHGCQRVITAFNPKHVLDEKTVQAYINIKEELGHLRDFAGAARVSVYQFHNGDNFTLSNPIFKLTCSHESVRKGLAFDSDVIKRILVSSFMDYVAPLMDPSHAIPGAAEIDGCPKMGDPKICKILDTPLHMVHYLIDDMPYSQFKYTMEQQGVISMYSIMLRSGKNKSPLGIINIQYQNEADHDSFIKTNICDICDIATRIQYLLDEAKRS